MKYSVIVGLLSLVQIATCNAQWTPHVVLVSLPQPAAAPAASKPAKVELGLDPKHASDEPALYPSRHLVTVDLGNPHAPALDPKHADDKTCTTAKAGDEGCTSMGVE